MDIMETFKPDIYEVMCDADVDFCSSTKRIRKSADHSIAFLEYCLDRHNNSKVNIE